MTVTLFGYLILISINVLFLRFLFFLFSTEKIYQTLKTVFGHIYKSSSQILHCTSNNQLFSPCLEIWSNIVFRVWCNLCQRRLRVVPLSLSPSCVTRTSVTRKKTARKKWPCEILGARSARKELLVPRISRGHFLSRGFLSRHARSRHARRAKRKRDYP